MIRLLNNNMLNKKREGSTLVSVVIGVLFLAAIGIIVLTAANSYMIAVNVDHNSSNNFYEAEQILEEVKTVCWNMQGMPVQKRTNIYWKITGKIKIQREKPFLKNI